MLSLNVDADEHVVDSLMKFDEDVEAEFVMSISSSHGWSLFEILKLNFGEDIES